MMKKVLKVVWSLSILVGLIKLIVVVVLVVVDLDDNVFVGPLKLQLLAKLLLWRYNNHNLLQHQGDSVDEIVQSARLVLPANE